MTGEITLQGRVLAIGGLKEKLLAAKQHDIKTVIIPKENNDDLQDIAKEIGMGSDENHLCFYNGTRSSSMRLLNHFR